MLGLSRRRTSARWRGDPYPWGPWVAVAVVAGLAIGRPFFAKAPPTPEFLEETTYEVRYVVDGDTLQLANGARVRLMGVDTPETVKPNHPVEPFGPEATAFTKDFVRSGAVRLQLDHERRDRYGRFLAFVWVDDRMLNEELVREGLARFEPNFAYSSSVKTRYRHAQAEAQSQGRGIWSLARSKP
ncbi:MAG TPA: thermonuclease family protein [Pirellulales bacterium]|nr:thermonuclease family protein [Pirellulales bacterium]